MDKPQSLLSGEHTRQISVSTPTTGGLMKFVKTTLTCLGCRAPLKEGQSTVCDHCRPNEVRAATPRPARLPPPSRTNWTRLVPPSVLTGHVFARPPSHVE